MATYDSVISRDDAEALIPEDVSREIIEGAVEKSSVFEMARRVPDMPRGKRRMPVLSMLPEAYFVSGGTDEGSGKKQTTKMAWENKWLYAEEIACIVPIDQTVLEDADYDIWAQIKPGIMQAFGKVIDAAILFSTNKPTLWPSGITTGAAAAANTVVINSLADLYEEIMGESGIIAKVEADGYIPDGHMAAIGIRGKLRSLRDADGGLIYVRDMTAKTGYTVDGATVKFPRNGCWDVTAAHFITGDWSQLLYAMRKDITYTVLREAVIQDAAGNIIYNLAQQDMVALRCVMRCAWQLPNPINPIQETEASRYPFGVLTPEA